MRTANHVYTVFDHKTKSTILVDADLGAVSMKTGIERYKVQSYAANKYKYLGRYEFIAKEIPKPEKPEKPVYVNKFFGSNDKAFMKVFDGAMAALKKNYPPEILRRIQIVQERQAG